MSDAEFSGISSGRKRRASAAATVTQQEAVAAPEAVKEKEFFDVKLGAVDAKAKIKIIKEVRTITNLGLKEVCCLGNVIW